MLEIDDIADVIASAVREATTPLLARLDVLEQREVGLPREQVVALADERKPDLSGLTERIAELEARPLPELPDVKALVSEQVANAVAAIPAPKDGAPGEKGESGANGRDGVDIADLIRGENGHIIATLSNGVTRDLGSFMGERGEQGERGLDGKDGRDGAPGETGAQGVPGIDGKDGAPGEDGRDGEPGQDGAPGADGRDGNDADPEAVKALVEETIAANLPLAVEKAVAALPPAERGPQGEPGKDGEKGLDGKDGRDGLGLENLHVEQDGRNVSLILRAGEEEAEFALHFPVPAYVGIYRPEQAYKAGDMVTYGGSVWHCDRDSKRAPNIANDEWTLCVKQGDRGRPGKDASGKELGE